MKEKETADQQELFPDLVSDYTEGRDELNLAEFPISTVGSRSNPGEKTITFEDTTFDKAAGQIITRRLTITGSDKSGLPTTLDDEVLLGMVQLSYKQGFRTREIIFKPLELLRILGWEPSGMNYTRLRKSLQRWHDVSLHYENAWRDKMTGNWVDADFHFIDNVEISKKGANSMMAPQGHSFFRWNEVVFRNFKAGNLRVLNFGIYLRLSSGVSKRAYRFLDKRFHMRSTLTFDLDVFAYEKIGLTRGSTNDAAQVKRRLRKAIQELESIGFIKPLPEKSRFTKLGAGRWDIHFEKAAKPKPEIQPLEIAAVAEDVSPIEERLTECGVTADQAKRMTRDFGSSQIELKLDYLDFISATKNPPKNPAGWIVSAVRENYPLPTGFKSRPERQQEEAELAEKAQKADMKKKARQEASTASEEAAKAQAEARRLRIQAYLENLSVVERAKLEKEAIISSPLSRGRLGPNIREAIIGNHVEAILKNSGSLPD